MTRLFVALLACWLTAAAQEPALDLPVVSIVDLVALDASGNPVMGLTAADFEITAHGKRVEPTRVTVFDAVAHTAKTVTDAPSLELVPDQIHRTTVIVIDDLCLPAAALLEAKRQSREFIERLPATHDQAAILRTSGGSTHDRAITSDANQLAAVIATTEPLGGTLPPEACAAAAWTAVSYAATGLASIPGRKALVLMSGDVRPPGGNAGVQLERLAAESMTAVYQTSATAPDFAAATGGRAGVTLDDVAAETRSFYTIAILSAPGEVEVKVRRSGVSLRTRRRSLPASVVAGFPVPPDDSDALSAALNSPFEASAIALRMTTVLTNTAARGSIIEVLCHIDAKNLGYLRDEQGRYHLAFQTGVQTVVEAGEAARPTMVATELHLSPDEYRRLVTDGLVVRLPVVWGAGSRDVRIVVADERSGRMGSANGFTVSNSVESGKFFLSGVGLLGDSTVKQSSVLRTFRPGSTVSYVYEIFNATVDGEGRSRVQLQSRLVAGAHAVFTGKPNVITFEPAGDPRRRQVNGRIQLDASMSAGRYIYEVTAVDQLSPEPRSASQFIDFTIEP